MNIPVAINICLPGIAFVYILFRTHYTRKIISEDNEVGGLV